MGRRGFVSSYAPPFHPLLSLAQMMLQAKEPGGEYMASLNGEVSKVNEDVDRFQPSES